MNNKDYISRMASRLEMAPKDVQRIVNTFMAEFSEKLDDGSTLTVQGFGNFEVKKKMERVVVNPTTKQRMLVPPKLVLAYRPSIGLKEKFKDYSVILLYQK